VENSGRKRKVSGTILAGAFTVPAAMSAAQQNVTSVIFFTEAATSVSDLFTKRTLNSFLKCAAYVILPSIALVAFGVLAYYAYKSYKSENISPIDWKIFAEEEFPDYSEDEKVLLNFLEECTKQLGILGTEINMDSKVLKYILEEEKLGKEEIKDLLKEKKVTFSISSFDYSGYFGLNIKVNNSTVSYGCGTKSLAPGNIDGIINLFNKIFKESQKQRNETIRLLLKKDRGNILLKTEGAYKNNNSDVVVNINDYKNEEKRSAVKEEVEKISLLRTGVAGAFVEKEDNKKINYSDKINPLIPYGYLKGKSFYATAGQLKKILEGTGDEKYTSVDSLAFFLKYCEENKISEDKVLKCRITSSSYRLDTGGLIFRLEIENGNETIKVKGEETATFFSTKPLKNDINAVIYFLNKLYKENPSKEAKEYFRLAKEGDEIIKETRNAKGEVVKKEKLTKEGFKEIKNENSIKFNINNDVFNINNDII